MNRSKRTYLPNLVLSSAMYPRFAGNHLTPRLLDSSDILVVIPQNQNNFPLFTFHQGYIYNIVHTVLVKHIQKIIVLIVRNDHKNVRNVLLLVSPKISK